MLEKFYLEKLYPLQDGVLKTVNALHTPFYLTGGTALSRYYFHHRYSDDLDLFVNNDPGYDRYIQAILRSLTESGRSEGFALDRQSLKKGEHFTQFFIERSFPSGSHVALKVDLIIDIAVRYGSLAHDSILGKIDDWRNILWISPLDPDGFPRICAQMAEDILLGRANTLHSR